MFASTLQVLSMGEGREGESGHVTPNEAVKPGDLVYVKDPYGIGESLSVRKVTDESRRRQE